MTYLTEGCDLQLETIDTSLFIGKRFVFNVIYILKEIICYTKLFNQRIGTPTYSKQVWLALLEKEYELKW